MNSANSLLSDASGRDHGPLAREVMPGWIVAQDPQESRKPYARNGRG